MLPTSPMACSQSMSGMIKHHTKKTNNTQTIKGNQAEIEPYACLVPFLHIGAGR